MVIKKLIMMRKKIYEFHYNFLKLNKNIGQLLHKKQICNRIKYLLSNNFKNDDIKQVNE